MVNGIIKKDGKYNYISFNKDSKRYYFFHDVNNNICISEYQNGIFKDLNFDKMNKIKTTVFPKYESFLKSENGKLYFLDLNTNYRVLNSNGYEDIDSFFRLNNGRKIIINPNLAKVTHNLYSCLNVKSVAFILALELAILVPLMKADKDIFLKRYYDSKPLISTEEVVDEIYDSRDGDLDKDIKDYLANEDFISDVLSYSDQERNYILHKKLHNIQLEFNEKACLARSKTVKGFYNSGNPNTIYLKEDNDEIVEYALAHEYVHLLQDTNRYSYIKEACAEMMASEYFDKEARAYFDLRQRVSVLMEIIGSDVIMECNFKGDTTNFETTIINYLGEEDGTKLLKDFKKFSSSLNDDECDELHKDVDKYLAKMYKNIYGKDISCDEVITSIYENGPILDRYYFNKHSDKYLKDNYIFGKDYDSFEIPLDEVLESKAFNYFTTVEHVEITEEEYNENEEARVYLKKNGEVQFVHKEYYEYLKDNNLTDGVEVVKYCESVFNDSISIKNLDEALNNENVVKICLRNSQARNNCVIMRGDNGFNCFLYCSKKVPSFGSKFKSNNKVKSINN